MVLWPERCQCTLKQSESLLQKEGKPNARHSSVASRVGAWCPPVVSCRVLFLILRGVLCGVVRCGVVSCSAALCRVVLCCGVLCCVVLCCVVLLCVVLWCDHRVVLESHFICSTLRSG